MKPVRAKSAAVAAAAATAAAVVVVVAAATVAAVAAAGVATKRCLDSVIRLSPLRSRPRSCGNVASGSFLYLLPENLPDGTKASLHAEQTAGLARPRR